MEISRNHAYGVSSKYDFGRWSHRLVGPFCTEEAAQDWLKREEYDFRSRELMSKTAAIRLAGERNFNEQIYSEENRRRYFA